MRSRRSLIVGVLIVVIVAAVALIVSQRPAGAVSTVLSILAGRADVAHAGGSFAPAQDGQIVDAGDKVRTAAASHALVTFFDGSTIEIEPLSQITVDAESSTDGATIIRLQQALGRTWSNVRPLLGPRSSYQIQTPAAAVAVRGTGLDVAVAGDGSTAVAVTDGTAAVVAQGVSVSLGPGTRTSVPPGGQPSPPVASVPPNTLRLGLHSPAYLSVVQDGRACGIVLPGPTVLRQIPDCVVSDASLESETIDLPDAPAGLYQLVVIAIGQGGAFGASALGLVGSRSTFEREQNASVGPGQILALSLRLERSGPDLRALEWTAFQLIGRTPIKAVIPSSRSGRLFAPGTLLRIQGSAMAPTIPDGEIVFYDPDAYRSSAPGRGDIVVFRRAGRVRILRIVGLPGDEVRIEHGAVSVRAGQLREPYLQAGTRTEGNQTYVVPAGAYFLLADDRALAASDSRGSLGFVLRSELLGKIDR